MPEIDSDDSPDSKQIIVFFIDVFVSVLSILHLG